MIFSSPFSPPSLAIPKPNQHTKSSPPSPFQSTRSLPIICTTRTSARMASSTFPSSTLPPNLTPSSPTAKSSSFYQVLGISMAATPEEVKAAYRKLARVCHPDVAAKDAPADEFMRIHTAYSTLSDPQKRADYDHRVLRRFTTLRTAPSGKKGPVYSRRKWETDQCW